MTEMSGLEIKMQLIRAEAFSNGFAQGFKAGHNEGINWAIRETQKTNEAKKNGESHVNGVSLAKK